MYVLRYLASFCRTNRLHLYCKSCSDKLKKLDNLKRQERELLAIIKGFVTSSKRVPETRESKLIQNAMGYARQNNQAV